MELSERQFRILNQILRSDAGVTVKSLASKENVTAQTVYNDLKLLENIRLSVNRGLIEIQSHTRENSVTKTKINETTHKCRMRLTKWETKESYPKK